jgi:hypothetical protein
MTTLEMFVFSLQYFGSVIAVVGFGLVAITMVTSILNWIA